MTGPRILFVGEAVALAHVSRPAVLARWAREAGYEVLFACGSAFAGVVRTEGFDPHPLPTISARDFYGRLDQGRFFYTEEELENYVTFEQDLLARTRPELVVGDFRLSLAVSTALAGIPFLSLINAHWSPARECRLTAPTGGFFGALPPFLRAGCFRLIRPLAFSRFARPLDRIRRRFGLPAFKDFREHYTAGTGCAYLDLPELVPVATLPPGHVFLGPIVWEPSGAPSPAIEGKRPLAYVSMGTSGAVSVLPNVLEALRGFEVVVSGKDRLVAPGAALRRAVVTICHGGSGTVYQSLAAGVPVLSIPRNPDQHLVADAVAATGAGMTIEPVEATSERLKQARAALVGEERFRRGARRIADALARHDTRVRWERVLRRLAPLSRLRSLEGARHDGH